jgi:hypothetical protein
MKTALQQMIAYTFIGGPEKSKELDYFIEKTKVDELMVATAIYQHEAFPTRFWDN